jgi:hypothetical protein
LVVGLIPAKPRAGPREGAAIEKNQRITWAFVISTKRLKKLKIVGLIFQRP